jgi:5-methylcytosine-specific restriction endonuclease McrA
MRDYAKLAPTFWTDHLGRQWKVPQIIGRLKMRCTGHAALRAFVIWRDGSKCKQCGCADPLQLLADHVVSRRNGGSHQPRNLQCLCRSCNARKSNLIDAKGAA